MPAVTFFLCGDVMTGRGIDQVLAHPSNPELHESHVKSARRYVELAERSSGAIPKPADFRYVWGDALAELDRVAPQARVINLETSVTTSADYAAKAIHYRMHPANTPCLTAAGIDCCALANNHVLDWGLAGLVETLATLRSHGLRTAGAGLRLAEASAPAILPLRRDGRILVFAAGAGDSGIPREWAASTRQAGVARLPDFSNGTVDTLRQQVESVRRPGDLVVFSIHWGPNFGYRIPSEHREFAHRLIDQAGVHLIHGHSSHHPKGIEVYKDRLVLYGCGDFLNDYEGIGGYEEYRGNLTLMYFATLEAGSGRLLRLEMTPLEIRRFRLERASAEDADWLERTLTAASQGLGCRISQGRSGRLAVGWQGS